MDGRDEGRQREGDEDEKGRTEPRDVIVVVGIEEVWRVVCRAVGQGFGTVKLTGPWSGGERRWEKGI